MMMLIDPYRYGVSGPATIEYLASYGETFTGTTTVSFADVDFGDVVPGRMIGVAVHMLHLGAAASVVSATIGGESAEIAVQSVDQGPDFIGAYYKTAIISALVPSGTSGPVAITFDENATAYIAVFRCTNIASAAAQNVASGTSASSPTSVTIDERAGGAVIASAVTLLDSAPFSMTGVTKNYDFRNQYVGGSAETPADTSAATIQMIDAAVVAGAPDRSLIAATFR